MKAREIARVLNEVTHSQGYPPEILPNILNEVERDRFKILLLAKRLPVGSLICDVGGGVGPFASAVAALGYRITVIDDLRDAVNTRFGESLLATHRRYGVEVIQRSALDGLRWDKTADAVICFATIEHQHRSPKRMLHSMMDHLKPGGLFVVSAPNCVDVMKRIETLIGRSRWSSMAEWYETDEFRGHVREPSVADLHYIARDVGLADYRIIGRNWIFGSRLKRTTLKPAACLFQLWPSLCTEIFLIGHRA